MNQGVSMEDVRTDALDKQKVFKPYSMKEGWVNDFFFSGFPQEETVGVDSFTN